MGIITLTASYAWVALATVNKIEDININAIGDSYNLLEMSIDGKNYFQTIPKEEILPYLSKLRFTDITSSDGINFFQISDKKEAIVANKNYLSLTFYFRTISDFTEIHLHNLRTNAKYDSPPLVGTYITSKGKEFKSNFDFQYGPDEIVKKGEVKTYYAKDAMRLSVMDYETNTAKIFDLSGNSERGFGKTFGAYDYYKIDKGLNLSIPETPVTVYAFSKFEDNQTHAVTMDSYLLTLTKNPETGYNEGKILLSVWLEGWDADAFDAIYQDDLKMQFMFKAIRPKFN